MSCAQSSCGFQQCVSCQEDVLLCRQMSAVHRRRACRMREAWRTRSALKLEMPTASVKPCTWQSASPWNHRQTSIYRIFSQEICCRTVQLGPIASASPCNACERLLIRSEFRVCQSQC